MCSVILHIAKAEWRKLFCSPVAWLILIVFFIQSGTLLMDLFGGWAEYTGKETARSLSFVIYGQFFAAINSYLYLYVPLLTMGLMSEELSNGTISLMYSSPISNRQIILGKYVSMITFGLLLSAILLVYVFLGIGAIKEFELGVALTGVLGMFLTFCTYAAIGLFVSSLISYQLLAAVGTYAIFGLLAIIGTLGGKYVFFLKVFYWLGINGRARDMANGLIASENLIYFVSISALFVVLTIIRLNAIRQKIPFKYTLGKNVGVIIAVCLIGYVSSLPSLVVYWDTTTLKWNTLHPTCQNIVKSVKEDATITLYGNILDMGGRYMKPAQVLADENGTFNTFLRFKNNIDFKYVYFYDNILNVRDSEGRIVPNLDEKELKERAKRRAYMQYIDTNILLTPRQIRGIEDLTSEENRSVRKIELSDGRHSWLRFFSGMVPSSLEEYIGIAFKQLFVPSPVIGYALESRPYNRLKDGYCNMFTDKSDGFSVHNKGFNLRKIDLKNSISEDISILMLADIQNVLSEKSEQVLQEYIDRGGNLILLGEPRRKELMNPLFRKFGFEMEDGILATVNSDGDVVDEISTNFMPQGQGLSFMLGKSKFGNYETKAKVVNCASLEQVEKNDFRVIPILQTDSTGVWNELQQEYITKEYNIKYDPETGEKEKAHTIAVGLCREINGKTQKVFLAGDADMMSNMALSWYYEIDRNLPLIYGILHWMSDYQYPLDMRRPPIKDEIFCYTKNTVKWLKITLLYVVPVLLLVVFGILWFRRRAR